jgi:anti-anti-sigma factor
VPQPGAHDDEDLTIRERDGVVIVRFNHANLLGLRDVQHLTDRIRALVEGPTQARKLVLDFKHVAHAGSATLGLMLAVLKTTKARGGRLVLSHTENLGPLLKLTKADLLFQIAPDAKAAMEMLSEEPRRA